MNPGEYTGKDGRRYRWTHTAAGYKLLTLEAHSMNWVEHPEIREGDIPAAKAALDALIEQEQEWVEIDRWRRIGRDGRNPQEMLDGWHPALLSSRDPAWIDAYRKGRETGLEDGREEAMELAEIVNDLALVEQLYVWGHPHDNAWQSIGRATVAIVQKLIDRAREVRAIKGES